VVAVMWVRVGYAPPLQHVCNLASHSNRPLCDRLKFGIITLGYLCQKGCVNYSEPGTLLGLHDERDRMAWMCQLPGIQWCSG
jgi:hypothetical protein